MKQVVKHMKAMVFIEKNPVDNSLRDVSIELTHKAEALLKPYSGEVVGIFVGNELPTNTELLFRFGMNRLIVYLNDKLKYLQSVAYKSVIEQIIRNEDPDIVLFGATHMGRDVAPLIASSLTTGLTADCTQLYIDDYKDKGKILYQMRPAFGGNILATIISPDHRPAMATVREGVMLLPDHKIDNPVKIEEFKVDFNDAWVKNEFMSIIPKKSKINLSATDVIVCGGAGVGSQEGFNLIKQLAKALGGEYAATRAAIDFGFADKDRQIGQTGAVVRPKLYIGAGLSATIQHRAGMEESQKIMAINTDPDAPLFAIAHMGIVGELQEVIPIMLKYLKEEG